MYAEKSVYFSLTVSDKDVLYPRITTTVATTTITTTKTKQTHET